MMVDSALGEEPHTEERAFGTQLNCNNNWSDNKYQKTPNDYYGKTKNRTPFYHSDNKSPIYKAFDNVNSKPKRFTNMKMGNESS